MKIAIPVDNNNNNTTVCVSFGRTPYYMIFDTEAKVFEFLDNTAANAAGGAGIKAAQLLVNQKIDVLLTPRCGENAAAVLLAANIKIYKTLSAQAKENIDLYIEGKLPELTDIHPGFHNHGN